MGRGYGRRRRKGRKELPIPYGLAKHFGRDGVGVGAKRDVYRAEQEVGIGKTISKSLAYLARKKIYS